MASLESLSNPLERTGVLPVTVNAGSNPLTGSLTWDIGRQYFIHDIAVSTEDGGAYMFTGESTLPARTTLRGGVDPALDTLGNWQKLYATGVGYANYDFADTVGTAAAGVYTFTAGNQFTVDESSDWLVTIQGTLTTPLATTAGDYSVFTVTGNGVGGTAAVVDIAPIADTVSVATSYTSTALVQVGTGGSTLTLTGAYVGQIPVLSGARFTITRLG